MSYYTELDEALGAEEEAAKLFPTSLSHDLLAKQGKAMKKYRAAKEASVGDIVCCPRCDKQFKKTTYHKVFCSNRKTAIKEGRRGGDNCKDQFWNFVRM